MILLHQESWVQNSTSTISKSKYNILKKKKKDGGWSELQALLPNRSTSGSQLIRKVGFLVSLRPKPIQNFVNERAFPQAIVVFYYVIEA